MAMNLMNLLMSLFAMLAPPAHAATALTATQVSIVYGSDNCYSTSDPNTNFVVNWQMPGSDVTLYDETFFTFQVSGTGAGSTGTFNNGDIDKEVHTGNTSGGYGTIYSSDNNTLLNGTAIDTSRQCLKWRSAPIDTDLLQRMEIIGFGSTATNSTAYATGGAASCVCFRVDVTTTNAAVSAVTKNGASETVTSTGYTEVLDTKATYEIVATSTSVTFFVNGAAIGTHTTNIPAGAMTPLWSIRNKTNAGRGVQLDWVQYSRPRIP